MKKYFIIGIAIITAISSCKKSELDLFPYNQFETPVALNSEANVSLALNGMYFGLRVANSYYVQGWTITGEVTSDNVLISQAGRLSQRVLHDWSYTGDNAYGLFQDGYRMVRRANAILEVIDGLQGSTPAFINNTKGQALACRAMVYFDMARVYSKTPLNASYSDYTIPYVTTTDQTIKPANETLTAVYGKIIKDLVDAKALITASNGVGKLNLASVNALLSKVYLYQGDYTNCTVAASAALGTSPSLGTLTTFPLVWKDESEAGVIFKIKNTDLDNLNALGVNYYQRVGGGIRSEYVVDYAFYQLFKSTDIRKATYTQVSPYNSVNQIHVIKYAGRAAPSPAGNVDAKVIRTAEVLLNRAESYYKSGNEPLALADINLLETNRYTGYVNQVLAGQSLLDEIYLQRRLELAFEGDRFWDLKRRNLPVQRSTFGDRADGTGASAVFKTLSAGDYRFSFPIPQNEINFNTNLKQVQGY